MAFRNNVLYPAVTLRFLGESDNHQLENLLASSGGYVKPFKAKTSSQTFLMEQPSTQDHENDRLGLVREHKFIAGEIPSYVERQPLKLKELRKLKDMQATKDNLDRRLRVIDNFDPTFGKVLASSGLYTDSELKNAVDLSQQAHHENRYP
ncbi:MAG: hypothetical protein M1818_001355 [Claussenomyces sp. TS43310]|nr:MAG: hypothetical protein M1818_001355 [Claussenomyces sp. TS43310]